jgi:hypothetical protein
VRSSALSPVGRRTLNRCLCLVTVVGVGGERGSSLDIHLRMAKMKQKETLLSEQIITRCPSAVAMCLSKVSRPMQQNPSWGQRPVYRRYASSMAEVRPMGGVMETMGLVRGRYEKVVLACLWTLQDIDVPPPKGLACSADQRSTPWRSSAALLLPWECGESPRLVRRLGRPSVDLRKHRRISCESGKFLHVVAWLESSRNRVGAA